MAITAGQLAKLMPDATELESCEPEFESSLHAAQLRLLVDTLEFHWRDRNDYFIGADLSIYYSRQMLTSRRFRSPHFFLVNGVEKQHRWSWVIWEEDGRAPDLIIELLSDETMESVKTIKHEAYARHIRIPEVFWFHPFTEEFDGFELCGMAYREIPPDAKGRRWSQALNLYLGVHNHELRYFTPAGELVLTPAETVSETATIAGHEARRVERLAAKLREFGIDPNNI